MPTPMPPPPTAPPAASPSVLALVPPDDRASGLWRQRWPIATLNARGHRVGTVVADPGDDGWLAGTGGFDVVVLPRFALPAADQADVGRWFAAVRATGGVVIGDYDDHLWLPDAAHAAGLWLARETPAGYAPVRPQRADEILTLADRLVALRVLDAVTVSTPALAAVVRALTPAPVAVVPNLLDLPWFRAVRDACPRHAGDGLTIGWAGGLRNAEDLAPVFAAWRRLAVRYPHLTHVTFGDVVAGIADLPRDRHVHIPRVELARYPAGFASIDIGCAAVADTPMGRCRSLNKLVEYGAAGLPVVASRAL